MILAVTGHRPQALGGHSHLVRNALRGLATWHLYNARPDHVITGMALGWDQAVAEACVMLDVPFTAAVPFQDQADMWPEEARARHANLLRLAEHVEVVSQFAGAHAMQLRNKWMVDRADDVTALWNGSLTGGTAHCVRYAQARRKPITNLWMRWREPDAFDEVLG